MKILITTDLYYVETNGVVTSVKNLTNELKRMGHEVRILSISNRMKSYKEGDVVFIRSLPTKVYDGIRMPMSYRHKYIKEIVKWKPDVIHSQCEFFSFRFAKYISRKTNAPIVHTYHTMYEDYVGYLFPVKSVGRSITRKVTKFLLEHVDSVIVPTDKVKCRHIENGVSCALHVIPSGIDLDKHKQRISAEEKAQLRERLGISDGAQVMLNLGRLATEKNVNELINYFASVCGEYPELIFLIVGGGPAKESLEKQTQELGLEGRVIFTGMVSPCDVHKYYQISNLFVSASTSETQGLTYIEAAANSLPLLCRRDPCLIGVIAEGKNGFSYETDAEFYAALKKLLQDRAHLAAMGEYSAEAVKPFDKSVFAESVVGVYSAAIEARRERCKSKMIRKKRRGETGDVKA